MGGTDRLLFRAINGWPDSLDPGLTAFSVANGWPAFKVALVAFVVLLAALRKGKAALLALIAFPLADGICNLLKHVAPMPRPFQVLENVTMRVGETDSMGTASSHAANMAAVATVMTLTLGWRWGVAWIALALATGVSRVYVGAHFPSQVLLGWVVGVGVGFAVARIAGRIVESRTNRDVEGQPMGDD